MTTFFLRSNIYLKKMQASIFISALYTEERDPNNFLSCVVGCSSFSNGVKFLEGQGFTVRNANLITSTLDVKSAMAKVSWRLSFKGTEGDSTTQMVFEDNWSEIQKIIDGQALKGYTIQFMTRTVSQYFQAE